jgi:hypothetical protein
LIEQTGDNAIVELGEGIRANCAVKAENEAAASSQSEAKLDLTVLSSMLNARWKGGRKLQPRSLIHFTLVRCATSKSLRSIATPNKSPWS